MDYCEYGDLNTFIKGQMGRPIDENDIWKFFIQACIGIQKIHSMNIIHRDIKPQNILLNIDKNVRIGDLGVAKVMEKNSEFAQNQAGTPFYMSPEILQDLPYNEKSDIWSLGVVLYELATFKRPFDSGNQSGLAYKILQGSPLPISQMYSKELQEMIDKCLIKNIKKRISLNQILESPIVVKKMMILKIQYKDAQNQMLGVQRIPYDNIMSGSQNNQFYNTKQLITQSENFPKGMLRNMANTQILQDQTTPTKSINARVQSMKTEEDDIISPDKRFQQMGNNNNQGLQGSTLQNLYRQSLSIGKQNVHQRRQNTELYSSQQLDQNLHTRYSSKPKEEIIDLISPQNIQFDDSKLNHNTPLKIRIQLMKNQLENKKQTQSTIKQQCAEQTPKESRFAINRRIDQLTKENISANNTPKSDTLSAIPFSKAVNPFRKAKFKSAVASPNESRYTYRYDKK